MVISVHPSTPCEEPRWLLTQKVLVLYENQIMPEQSFCAIILRCCLPQGITSGDGAKSAEVDLTASFILYIHFCSQEDIFTF